MEQALPEYNMKFHTFIIKDFYDGEETFHTLPKRSLEILKEAGFRKDPNICKRQDQIYDLCSRFQLSISRTTLPGISEFKYDASLNKQYPVMTTVTFLHNNRLGGDVSAELVMPMTSECLLEAYLISIGYINDGIACKIRKFLRENER